MGSPEEGRGTFEDLDAGEHGLLACRAESGWDGQELVDELTGTGRRSGQWIRMIDRGLEGEPAPREHTPPAAVSEQPVVADAHEASRQDVQQEAPSELGERELLMSQTPSAVVLEAKADVVVVEGSEAVVGDGDAVGVASEVSENGVGPVEGRFGEDDPGLLEAAGDEVVEGRLGKLAEQASAVSVAEPVEVAGPEETAEHTDGEEKPAGTGQPGAPVGGESTGRDDAVQVGMVDEGLPPGVEHGEEPDAGPEEAGVGGHIEQGGGGGAEEEIVEDPRMSEREGPELVGQGEDHVGVGHGEHIGLALLEPVRLGAALALGTVPVAARVVGDLAVAAVGAGVDVAPERRGAAPQDPVDDPALLGPRRRDRNAGALHPAKDLGDLVRRSPGHLSRERKLEGVEGTPGRADALGGDVHVQGGCLDGAVAEQDLDETQVGAVLHEMGGEAVAEHMGGHPLRNAGGTAGAGDGPLHGALVEGATRVAARKQPVGGPMQAPVAAKRIEQERREHRLALHIALAVADHDDPPGAVDVTEAKMEGLRDPEPGAVEGHGDGALFERGESGEKPGDLIPAQDHRTALGAARIGKVRDHPLAPQGDPVEEAQGGGHLLVGRQRGAGFEAVVAKEVADLLRSEHARAATEVGRHLRDPAQVHRLGAGRVIAQLEVGQHLAAKGRHGILPVQVSAGEPRTYPADA